MSNDNFLKGGCQHCGGHFEFPADAAGDTSPCPHCGQPTQLVALTAPNPPAGMTRRTALTLIIWGCIVIGTVVIVVTRPGRTPAVPTPVMTNAVAATPEPPKPRTDEVVTNDFSVTGIKLEKQAGTSLVYVTGQVRNLAPRQRFGVTVEFTLFDTNDQPVGKAKDYEGHLETQGKWSFKAMVLESKTTYARLLNVTEAQ
jgi:hypothetical protein